MNQISVDAEFTMLIAAAGQGHRLGLGPKAFLRLGEKSLLQLVASLSRLCTDKVLVAAPPGMVQRAKHELSGIDVIEVITGGQSRQQTYHRLVEKCQTPFVAIRDVARPIASPNLIRAVMSAAKVHGAAGAFQRTVLPNNNLWRLHDATSTSGKIPS